jgi:PKD repeat protein
MVELSRRRSKGAISVASVVALLTISVLLLSPGPHAGGAPTATFSFAAVQLQDARSSLAGGHGPTAAGTSTAGPTPPTYTWGVASRNAGSAVPSGRYFGQMTWDAFDGYVLLYGGRNTSGFDYSDTWTYLNGTWTNITSTLVGPTPPPTYLGSLAYDPSTLSVVLFGGSSPTDPFQNFTWTYHAGAWKNLTGAVGKAPSGRITPGLSTDSTAGEVLLVGGFSGGVVPLNDTWTFRDDKWTNVTSVAPLDALFIAGALTSDDPAEAGVLAVGAVTYNKTHSPPYSAGTFLFTGGVWKNLTGTNPEAPGAVPLIVGGSIGYLPAIGAVVVSLIGNATHKGGLYVAPLTWQFTDGTWKNVSQTAGTIVGATTAGQFGVEPYDSAFLYFSGINLYSGVSPRTLFGYHAPPTVTVSATPTTLDVGQTVSFNGSAQFGVSPRNASWSFGDGANQSGLSGHHTYATAGVYLANLTVTDLFGEIGVGSVAIVVHPAPTATIVLPATEPYSGSATAITALVSGGSPPFTLAWTLGDGTSAVGATVNHTYAASGSYSIALTVTDSVGVAVSAKATLTVQSVPSNSGTTSLTSGTGLYLVIGIIVLAVVAALLGALLARKGRGARPPPTPYTPSSVAPAPPPPPGSTGPPPGAT